MFAHPGRFFLLFFYTILLTGCSAAINPMHGKHKDQPQDFIERRKPVDNDYIAMGGRKKNKNHEQTLLPGQQDSKVIPDNREMMVGGVGYDEKRGGNEDEQVTYTYSKLKENQPKEEGFSKDLLNISNQPDGDKKASVSYEDFFLQDGEKIACADQEVKKEIDSAKISEKEMEEAKEQKVYLS